MAGISSRALQFMAVENRLSIMGIMQIKMTNNLAFFLLCFSLLSCKVKTTSPFTLYYDFYRNGVVIPKEAVKIIYHKDDKADYSKVSVLASNDSIVATFYQKVTDTGILRSLSTFDFEQSHSFFYNKEMKSNIEKPKPHFLNIITTKRNEKNFLFGGNDSVKIIFFDEAIPWYSFTCSYYLKEYGLFLIYYNCAIDDGVEYKISEDGYYRLSGVDGIGIDMHNLARLIDKVITDTSLFAKYYKIPLNNTLPFPTQ